MPSLLSLRLQRLQRELQDAGRPALREFWDEIQQRGTPLIEPASEGFAYVTFLWKHAEFARHVAVIQDWGADGIREHHMTRLPGSDVWYLTRVMRSDTRTTYQLSPSAAADPGTQAPYELDPLNPHTFTVYPAEAGPDIRFSLLELPDAPALPWRHTSAVAPGVVQLHTPFSDQRRLWVYGPPARHTAPLPLLLVFDGRQYQEVLKLPAMLDYLIEHGAIPPLVALLIDSLDRSELLCQPAFADYVTQQVLPWLQATYAVALSPAQTIVVGSSFGGLAAAYFAFRYPHTYGTALSQTGWFRWHPAGDIEHHWLARQIAAEPKAAVRFWLQVGSLEVAQMLDGGPSQLAANQHLYQTLQAKGYFVKYQEYSGGHDLSNLEFPLAQALTEILASLHPT